MRDQQPKPICDGHAAIARLAAYLACVALAGCSYFVQTTPMHDPGTRPVACSTDDTAPRVDVVGAIAFGALSGLAFVAYETTPGGETDHVPILGVLGVVFLIPTVIYAVSAHGGFANASRCEEYQRPLTAR